MSGAEATVGWNTNAFLIATLSGLSTGLGGLMVLFVGEPSPRKLGHLMSFSAGVMIYISFMYLLPEAIEAIGFLRANIWFFLGMLVFGLIARLFPEHEHEKPEGTDNGHTHNSTPRTRSANYKGELAKAKRAESSGKPSPAALERIRMVGIITAIGLSLHNIPEGIAVYLASLKGVEVGFPLAVAIAAHNIPEGMAVASPIYHATGSKKQAFFYSLLSGVCEPAGALVFGLFITEMSNTTIQSLLAAVGGIMVLVSCRELLPVALEYLKPEPAMISNALGMMFISVSIYLLHGSGGLHSHSHGEAKTDLYGEEHASAHDHHHCH